MNVFDRRLLRLRRNRAAAGGDEHDFLFREVADRLSDRLLDVKRSFPAVLDLGGRNGAMTSLLAQRQDIETLVQCDLSPEMTRRAAAAAPCLPIVADEELLPFAERRFDLVVSNLSLHWANDLPGALAQIRRALKPDGLFLAAMLGGETLTELRRCLMRAEIDEMDGASPRVSPFVDLRDAGALLQRADFALPVVDGDRITVTYGNALELMADLRRMGEANAVQERVKHFTRRRLLLRAAELYQADHAQPDGRIPATFHVVYLHGWAPHESQQQPLRPGSARLRLAEALGTTERPAGDKARPR